MHCHCRAGGLWVWVWVRTTKMQYTRSPNATIFSHFICKFCFICFVWSYESRFVCTMQLCMRCDRSHGRTQKNDKKNIVKRILQSAVGGTISFFLSWCCWLSLIVSHRSREFKFTYHKRKRPIANMWTTICLHLFSSDSWIFGCELVFMCPANARLWLFLSVYRTDLLGR